jgi:hypothetical protein
VAKNKTNAQLEAELRLSKRQSWIDGFFSALNNVIRWGTVAYIAHEIYLTVGLLAGKSTFADIGLKFFADIRVSEGVSYLLGASGVGYGLSQRKLRRKNIERLQGRIVTLEKQIDRNRTSSRLTETGETNPEDR